MSLGTGGFLLWGACIFWAVVLVLQTRRVARMRQAKLVATDVVELDGLAHVVVAVETRLDGVTEYAFEPLGELLARTLRVGGEGRTLYEELSRAGWRPPTAEGRPTLVKS